MNVLRKLPQSLISERGMGGFVCIWRDGDNGDHGHKGAVGGFLSRPENQSGTWLIDGGWGGPPGAIHVRWNDEEKAWENGGYGGRSFAAKAAPVGTVPTEWFPART